MTPDDTSTVSQVFLYEAAHEALIRVSAGQDGFKRRWEHRDQPASIYNGASSEGRRVISEDGSTVVFESSQALTAQVHGGADNVYLWWGNVYLISDGTWPATKRDLGRRGLSASTLRGRTCTSRPKRSSWVRTRTSCQTSMTPHRRWLPGPQGERMYRRSVSGGLAGGACAGDAGSLTPSGAGERHTTASAPAKPRSRS